MKQVTNVIIGVVAISALLLPVIQGRAAAVSNIITDEQIAAIKTHCVTIQASLNQLHQSDALLRHNRGQLYRTVADKLMSPLNQRIASNQLDGGELVETAADFSQAYGKFYTAYQTYETALSGVLDIDCKRQPTTFYSKLLDARDKRIQLHQTSQAMVALAGQYKVQFDQFAKELSSQAKEEKRDE